MTSGSASNQNMSDCLSLTTPLALRTFIVTDVSLFWEGLRRLLAAHPEVEVVGCAIPTDDVGALVATMQPDVVLVDSTTARASELAPRVGVVCPSTRVVAFAIAEQDEDEVLACAEAGVAGFVARNATMEELVAVLRSAPRGEVRCPPHVTATVFRQMGRLAPFRSVTPHEAQLTLREVQIASLICDGLTNKEMAAQLGIAAGTVKNHVHNILEKLHVRRRADVATLNLPTRTTAQWRQGPANGIGRGMAQ
jgi:two-component system, NarL family, nitrate/nitrite response regulator NarL